MNKFGPFKIEDVKEKIQTGPLKRNSNKRKTNQRKNVTNDVIALHSRMMNKFKHTKNNIAVIEQKLVDKHVEWKGQLLDLVDIQRRIKDTRASQANEQIDSNNDILKTLTDHQSVLYQRLLGLKDEAATIEAELNTIRSGSAVNDYLLTAVPFLNAHHALTSDMIKLEKDKGASKRIRMSTDSPECIITDAEYEERHTKIIAGMKENSREYTALFYPELVRDSNKHRRPDANNPYECGHCGGEVMEVSNSHRVCQACGAVANTGFSIRNQTNNLNWEDMKNTPTRQYTYRRLNHFREYMRQIQGLSRATIPARIYDDLREEFRKSRIDIKRVTPDRVRAKLSKIKQSKYYEHCESIAAKLSGVYKPITIDPVHEEKLCLMFVQLEEPFERIKHLVKKDRKNFLSYPFAFYKLNELSNWDEYNRSCSLLKSITLINKQDAFWKLVMDELGWEVVGRTFDINRK